MSLLRFTWKAIAFTQSKNISPIAVHRRSIKRWVAPTLKELYHRAKKLGPQPEQPRSGFIEWNYRSELFAFGKRLNEDFQLPLLQSALTSHSYVLQEEKRQSDLGVAQTNVRIEDNRKLAEVGLKLTEDYVKSFLRYSLPKVPEEGQKAIADSLLSQASLAHIASHLGTKDLILCSEYPPEEQTYSQTFLALVGALQSSSGTKRAQTFVRDFVCTQLNQCDLLDRWHIENPEELLKRVCKERQMGEPEPRLIGDSAKNTVLAAYHVGIYSNKKLLGTGFGEDVNTSIKTAALDALQTMFGIQPHITPFNFRLQVQQMT